MKRREFLKRTSAYFASASVLPLSEFVCAKPHQPQSRHPEQRYVSAVTDPKGRHFLAIFDAKTGQLTQCALPSRAHEIIVHPNQPILAAVARRPGYHLTLVDTDSGETITSLSPQPDHHFFGHGLFTPDGQYLVTSEAAISTGQGRIVIRDTNSHFEILANLPSHGIGPHQIKLAADQQTLIVANGGILTHPERGRGKLNLDTMQSSLDYVDLGSGTLRASYRLAPELHQLSIRHIDVNALGQVAIAMQYQGDPIDEVPLIGMLSGEKIHLLEAPKDINRRMKHYCGSVTFDHSGAYFCVSSPRGNLATFWHSQDKRFIASSRCRDVCGISALGTGTFALSNGGGRLYRYDLSTRKQEALPLSAHASLMFDNHLSTL